MIGSNISCLCGLLGYSRQAYYKHYEHLEKQHMDEDLLLEQVLSIRQKQSKIGAKKLYNLLKPFMEKHRIEMGRDKWIELLRANNLLMRKQKRRKPMTTFSNHPFKKYRNLIENIELQSAGQVWVCDMTYIDIQEGFAYLSLITDMYSRKILGYCLYPDRSTQGFMESLQMALSTIAPRNQYHQRLIHHSDRGVQYCSHEYVGLLEKNFIEISMAQKGNPLENPIAERVNGILKMELLEECYENFQKAQLSIDQAIATYNHLRPHSSVNMLTPEKAHNQKGTLKRLWKNYYSKKDDKGY